MPSNLYFVQSRHYSLQYQIQLLWKNYACINNSEPIPNKPHVPVPLHLSLDVTARQISRMDPPILPTSARLTDPTPDKTPISRRRSHSSARHQGQKYALTVSRLLSYCLKANKDLSLLESTHFWRHFEFSEGFSLPQYNTFTLLRALHTFLYILHAWRSISPKKHIVIMSHMTQDINQSWSLSTKWWYIKLLSWPTQSSSADEHEIFACITLYPAS